jgi:hypothetical protein
MINCPKCGEPMTEAYVMGKLPPEMIRSEGARAMALSGKRNVTSEHGRKAANVRWELVKQATALGIPNAHKMTKAQLNAAIDKVFE